MIQVGFAKIISKQKFYLNINLIFPGILCGSEADQQSLNNRRSHESLDSGQSECEGEECMEIAETNSMDEDYRELQADLCLYQQQQSPKKKIDEEVEKQQDISIDKKHRYRELNMNKTALLKEKYHQTICVPIEYEESDQFETAAAASNGETEESTVLKETPTNPKDPTFKNFFFKNAIFRTAQSIIENHEKKSVKSKESSANDNSSTVTSTAASSTPSTSIKKRDFSIMKSRSKNNHSNSATQLSTSASAEIVPSPPEKQKGMTKSSSVNSLTMKVPGTACMVSLKESVQPQIKTERGQSGLLRFFESPVFNIHFAIHYLFYSKEPGVLSFIGNKIFRWVFI